MLRSAGVSSLLRSARFAGLFASGPASAEPYLAVESGLKCANCHVNPTGGGKRTPFGKLYARSQISAQTVTLSADSKPWTGDVTKWFAVGATCAAVTTPSRFRVSRRSPSFDVTRATVYAGLLALPNLLSFYFDEKVAPDNVENREAYVLLDAAATVATRQGRPDVPAFRPTPAGRQRVRAADRRA